MKIYLMILSSQWGGEYEEEIDSAYENKEDCQTAIEKFNQNNEDRDTEAYLKEIELVPSSKPVGG